jgi:di/tricarboxylate transporter
MPDDVPKSKVNWKAIASTLVSALTILAALPYQLGELSTIIPPNWKPTIVAAGLIATIALRVWNAATVPQTSQAPLSSTEIKA